MGLKLTKIQENTTSAWHLFVIGFSSRDKLQEHLQESGIETLIHYPISPHLSGAYQKYFLHRKFNTTEYISSRILSLPIGTHLSIDSLDIVIKAIKNYL